MKEVFKSVPNYPHYFVSNLGNVKSTQKGKERLLSKRRSKNGYLSVLLYKENEKPKTYNIHQLVCMAFLGHLPNRYESVIDHLNNVRDDNRLENLRVTTARQNTTKEIVNKKGYCGVTFDKESGKYMARITKNKKSIYIGRYPTIDDAYFAYLSHL